MGGTSGDGVLYRNITYSPFPSQKLFHKSLARFRGFSGPIGSGKSQALCQEAIRMAYENPGRLGLLGAPTYPMLRDATQQTLFGILHENKIPYDFGKAENLLELKDTRSRVLFRAVDDFERLRGTNLAWFGVDELTYTPEAAWLRLEGRLRDPKAGRQGGFAVWTPKGFEWVYRRFLSEPPPGYQAIRAAPFENKYLADFYEQLKGSYDEKFYEQEVLGEYLNMQGGLVYHAFTREQNMKELAADPAAPLLWALDFNVDPMSSIVAQIMDGSISVLDEVVLRHASTEEACESFWKRFGNHAGGVVVYGDASGNNPKTTGNTDFQVIRKYFGERSEMHVDYRVPKANPPVRQRVNLMNAKLKPASGDPQLFVDKRCKELIKDFEQVAYKEDSNQIDKDRDRSRTHLSDALGYLVWQECRVLPTIGEKRERLL